MRTTIDADGRLVVPREIRDAMGLEPGRAVDVVYTDGRIEIEVAPALTHVAAGAGLPRIVADEDLSPLTDRDVRDTLEATRR
jgi:AbrB family looped-hinge helix DNA binding protein